MENHILKYILADEDRATFNPPKFFLPANSKIRIAWEPDENFKKENYLCMVSTRNPKGDMLFSLLEPVDTLINITEADFYIFTPKTHPVFWEVLGALNFYLNTTSVTTFFTSHLPEKIENLNSISPLGLSAYRNDLGKCIFILEDFAPKNMMLFFNGAKDDFSKEEENIDFIHTQTYRVCFKVDKGDKIYIQHPQRVFKKFSCTYQLFKGASGLIADIYDSGFFIANENAVYGIDISIKKLHKIKEDFPEEPKHIKIYADKVAEIIIIKDIN